MGWSVRSPAWGVLAPIAMWAPAVGRLAARRTVDRGFTSTLPLRRCGATGAQVILWPLAVPLAVYGAAYAIAWTTGFAHWSPGGGKWTTRWLFPRFFAGGEDELWLGEGGLLPVAGYVVLGAALFLRMRRRGQTWQALARHAFTTSRTERAPRNSDWAFNPPT